MEPIKHTLTARLGSLKMYREEIDELVAMFQNSCGRVILSDSNHRYDSLDEMQQHGFSTLTDFDIRGENPGVRFLLNQREAYLSNPPAQLTFNELRTEEITEPAEALYFRVKDFLNTHQLPRVRKGFLAVGLLAAIGTFWFAHYLVAVGDRGRTSAGSVIGFVLCLVGVIGFIGASTNVKNEISLISKRNSASFFVRNREEFLKHAVTSAISGSIGAFIGYCVGHFVK